MTVAKTTTTNNIVRKSRLICCDAHWTLQSNFCGHVPHTTAYRPGTGTGTGTGAGMSSHHAAGARLSTWESSLNGMVL